MTLGYPNLYLLRHRRYAMSCQCSVQRNSSEVRSLDGSTQRPLCQLTLRNPLGKCGIAAINVIIDVLLPHLFQGVASNIAGGIPLKSTCHTGYSSDYSVRRFNTSLYNTSSAIGFTQIGFEIPHIRIGHRLHLRRLSGTRLWKVCRR